MRCILNLYYHNATKGNTEQTTNSNIFTSDLYILDGATDFSIVAKRSKNEELSISDQLISNSQRQILNKYLSSFEEAPLLLTTKSKALIVFGSIFPSTLLCPVIVFDRNSKSPQSSNEDALILDSEALSAYPEYKSHLIGSTPFMINTALLSSSLPDNILNILDEQIKMLSSVCGCKAELTEPSFDPNRYTKDLDMPLFTAFTTLSLLLSRRVACDRSAEIHIEALGERLLICASFEPLNEYRQTRSEELITLRSIARRLNTVFYRTTENGKVTVKFCPCRKDWSLYGLKTHDAFIWDGTVCGNDHFYFPQA